MEKDQEHQLEKAADKKPGRPFIKLDENLLLELSSIHCTNDEIAKICNCSEDTLRRNYAHVLEKGRENAKASLRREQWKMAKKGNVQMLIWLGKQWLGQKDKSYEEVAQIVYNVNIQEIP